MNRNVSILIIILVILLIAGYLLLLRSRIQKIDSNIVPTPTVEAKISETPVPTIGITTASSSATPSAKPTNASTGSGSKVK